MDDDSPVPALFAAARDGDRAAWNALVERYARLVLSIVWRFRIHGDDADDVVQTVWLRLVENLESIREPRALPGWIATTTRNECLRLVRARQRVEPVDPQAHGAFATGATVADGAVDVDLLEDERHQSLLVAFAELPDRQRELLLLLVTDPPLSYQEVSARLGIPIGSIGPTRARALARIRSCPAVAALLEVGQGVQPGR